MKRHLLLLVALVSCSSTPATPVAHAEPMASLDVPPLPPSATAPPATRAEPPPEKTVATERNAAVAEALFQEGRAAFARGDYTSARDKLAESYRLDPATGTLLNLAEAETKLGDNASARRHYQEAYNESMASGRADRAAVAKARMNALPP